MTETMEVEITKPIEVGLFYPVSEIFYSIQGEGAQSGMPMVFVRLAGCTVGKPYTTTYKSENDLKVFQTECTTWDGRKFPCDTDYRKKMSMTTIKIVEEIRKLTTDCKWICITGGEPMMHNLTPLLKFLKEEGFLTHLETSGTTLYYDSVSYIDWVVVSPKFPFNDMFAQLGDEIRILVDNEFSWSKLPESVRKNSHKVWISPINDVDSINPVNAGICSEIAKEHPEIRISLQIHKILGVR
jgi:7-carboxy-7-deazaguanine synthase